MTAKNAVLLFKLRVSPYSSNILCNREKQIKTHQISHLMLEKRLRGFKITQMIFSLLSMAYTKLVPKQ